VHPATRLAETETEPDRERDAGGLDRVDDRTPSGSVAARGFSQKTAIPRRTAAVTTARCVRGVAT